MVTIYDIAKELGVSSSTVSRALNRSGYVKAEVRDKILKRAEELGFMPNITAQNLKKRSTQLIGLGIPDILNSFYTEVARGVQDVAEKYDYTVIICNTDGNAKKEFNLIQLALRRRIDGLILFPLAIESESIHLLTTSGLPTVLCDAREEFLDMDVVITDDIKGAFTATEHLIKLGHTRIGFLGGPVNAYGKRLEGYKKALAQYGIPFDMKLVFATSDLRKAGFDGITYFLKCPHRPTAIFAVNDNVAIDALSYACDHGLSIPEDLAIIGFDAIREASVIRPRLSTMAQDKFKMGEISAELLIQRIQKRRPLVPQRVILEPTLVIRESTGPPRTADLGQIAKGMAGGIEK